MTLVMRPIYKISFLVNGESRVFDRTPNGLKLWYKRNGLEEYINRFACKGAAIGDLMMRVGVLASETVSAGDVISDDADMLKKVGTRYAFSSDLANETGAKYTKNPLEIFEI